MPFVATPNGLSLELRYNWNGQLCENVLNFQVPTDLDPAALETFGSGIASAWATHAAPATVNTCRLTELYFTDLSSVDGFTFTFIPEGGVPGTQILPSMPNNVSCALSLRTNSRGRSYRGRIYPPGMAEASADANVVGAGWRAAWLAFVSNVMSEALDAGFALAVLSKRANGVERPTGVLTAVTTILFTDDVIDSQRRRLPGRGR